MSDNRSGWAVGWTAFAMTMMFMMGLWWIIIGLVGVGTDNFFVATPNWVLNFDVTTWGWIHFFVGVLVLFASFGLYIGAVWARVVGVIIAILASVAAFAWLPHYPAWAIVMIAISVAVIWALTAHGRDIVEP